MKRMFTILGILLVLSLVTIRILYLNQTPASSNHEQPSNTAASSSASDNNRGLGIPAKATVLALPGMDFHLANNMPKQFQGYFSKSPYKMSVVDYPRSASSTSISTGVKNLNTALRSTSGKIIVLAYSQGAQVASNWMRQYADDASAPSPAKLTFILFGNPYRAVGGAGIGKLTWDGTLGYATRTDTPWHIVDVARRYDGWADWPQDTKNSDATKNATAGKLSLHVHYGEVNINDPTHTVWTKGNTTFVLTKESGLPIYANKSVTADQITAMRKHIESAYNRQ